MIETMDTSLNQNVGTRKNKTRKSKLLKFDWTTSNAPIEGAPINETDEEKIAAKVAQFMDSRTLSKVTIKVATTNIKTIIRRYNMTTPSQELYDLVITDMKARGLSLNTIESSQYAILLWAEANGTPLRSPLLRRNRLVLSAEAVTAINKVSDFIKYKRQKRLSDVHAKVILSRVKSMMYKYGITVPSEQFAIEVYKELDIKHQSPRTITNMLYAIEIWGEAFGIKMKLSKPTMETKRKDFLTEEECKDLIEKGPASWRDRAVLHLLMYGGLRGKELINADIADVDFTHNQIHIKSKYGEDIESRGIKNHNEGVVSLNGDTMRALKEYISTRPSCKSPALFITRRADRFSTRSLEDVVSECAVRAGVRNGRVYPYLLRHTCATQLVNKNVNLLYVKEHLRHKSLKQTLTYAHPTEKAMGKIMSDMRFY